MLKLFLLLRLRPLPVWVQSVRMDWLAAVRGDGEGQVPTGHIPGAGRQVVQLSQRERPRVYPAEPAELKAESFEVKVDFAVSIALSIIASIAKSTVAPVAS